MRWIEYDYVCNEQFGIILNKRVEYNEVNLAIAKKEACNGDYTITEDDESVEINPIAIELGGTGAKTVEEACKNIGGINEYVHSSNGLSGMGTNGKFKATLSGSFSSIEVNGVAHSVKQGEESSVELTSGCWYTFILDGKTVNFSVGGGGGSSAFAIVCKSSRPTSVAENTMWVNTTQDATKYALSAVEPVSPTEGMIWVMIADAGSADVTAPVGKEWIKLYLGMVQQYVNGVWTRREAKLYKDGEWIMTSTLFTAYITVTYPANSTCNCVNGAITLTDTNATDTEKTVIFIVPSEGTWTITSTANDGSDNSTFKEVEITTEGQSVSRELSYQFVLFSAETGLAEGYSLSQGSVSGGVINAYDGGDPTAVTFETPIDVTKFSTLIVEFGTIKGGHYLTFGLRDTYKAGYDGYDGNGYAAFIGGTSKSDPEDFADTTHTLDLSSITGKKYVKLSAHQTSSCQIKRIIFE